MEVTFRRAKAADHLETEQITRAAFWDLYRPGCDEHLILHNLRRAGKVLPELDLVGEAQGHLVASIAYTKGIIETSDGRQYSAITFGPVSVRPAWQRRGIGTALIGHSLDLAGKLGHGAVFITGDPAYYGRFGFEAAASYGVFLPGMRGEAADYFMVKLLRGDALKGIEGTYYFDPAYETDPGELAGFDRQFRDED